MIGVGQVLEIQVCVPIVTSSYSDRQADLRSAASRLRQTEDVSHNDVRSLRLGVQGCHGEQEKQDRSGRSKCLIH